MSTDLIVTFRHLRTVPYFKRSPGFCRPKSQEWFKRHGLNWRDFVRNGISAAVLEATGDGFALAIVEWARKCESEAPANG